MWTIYVIALILCIGAQRGNTVTGCEDRDAEICEAFVDNNHLCYDVRQIPFCCLTCRTFLTDTPGCEYGDHNGYCARNKCGVGNYSIECCETCGNGSGSETRTANTGRGRGSSEHISREQVDRNDLSSTSVHSVEKGTTNIANEDEELANSGKLALIVGMSVGAVVLLVLAILMVVMCVRCRGKKTTHTDDKEKHPDVTYDAAKPVANIQSDQLGLEENSLYATSDQLPTNGDAVIYSTPVVDGPPRNGTSRITRTNRDDSQYANVQPEGEIEGLVYADLSFTPATSSLPKRTDTVTYSEVQPRQPNAYDQPMYSVVA